jgi:mannonate dehydratase
VFAADEMWENYGYFMRAVLPVAEEAGVKLALVGRSRNVSG